MRWKIAVLSGAVIVLAAAWSSAPARAADDFGLESTIAFSSTRDHVDPALTPVLLGAEVYLAKPVANGTKLTDPRRLSNNSAFDGFANLSPDGQKIAFDSTRRYTGSSCSIPLTGCLNVSDLFLMNTDGSQQNYLTHGSSATWSPDSKEIAFHASASGTGTPIRTDPGSATTDSDIFVARVEDTGLEQRTDITNSPTMIDDDPDWSPNGQKIVFTSHAASDLDQRFTNDAELYLMNPDGTNLQRLTANGEEERAPAWSPDGTRIVYSCRVGAGTNPFRICVMNADGSQVQQLTHERDAVSDLTATWSPDGQQILYHRGTVKPDGTPGGQQLFVMKADGCPPSVTIPCGTQLTDYTQGVNNLAHWGVLDEEPTP
jgi:Tol biopolymer transport system component